MSVKDYRDLIAWQKAMEFVLEVYRSTQSFPKDEMYGLTSQLRRAAVSIPSNVAEGQGRRASREFQRFLNIAHGSLRESETQILIAQRLGYTNDETAIRCLNLASEVGKLITGLLIYLDSPQQ